MIFFIDIWKMSECNSVEKMNYWRNRDVIQNRAKAYYANDKERLKKQARHNYRNLSEEGKNKKRESGRNSYHNMSQEKKQELKESQKITVTLKNQNKKF